MSYLDAKTCILKIQSAIDWLLCGRVLAYPSESVYALGVDATSADAITRLLALKSRIPDKGFVCLAASLEVVLPHLDAADARALSLCHADTTPKAHPVTYLVRTKDTLGVSSLCFGVHVKLALRIPRQDDLQMLCCGLISPHNPAGLLVSTSANLSAHPPAQNLAEAQAYFGNKVGYLPGDGLGLCKPSTIIDLQSQTVIRP